jgi:hypothetical protein
MGGPESVSQSGKGEFLAFLKAGSGSRGATVGRHGRGPGVRIVITTALIAIDLHPIVHLSLSCRLHLVISAACMLSTCPRVPKQKKE